MKKLILALFIFIFIITSSHKSALVGSWQSQNGDVIAFSQTHISTADNNLPYSYVSDDTIIIIENNKPVKIHFILSFDENILTIFGKTYFRLPR